MLTHFFDLHTALAVSVKGKMFARIHSKTVKALLYSHNLDKTMNPSALLVFKYLNLGAIGGRGGVQRFFMLANDIKFEEELFAPGDAWAAEKKRMMETGDNPCGTVPVTIFSGDEEGAAQSLSQHIAVCRYLARLHKLDTGDAYKDYVQDLVADEYQPFRAEWEGRIPQGNTSKSN
jgi:hypothetical protein